MRPQRCSPTVHPAILFRRVETAREYAACMELQQEIWGANPHSLVPTTILKIGNRIGGVTLGAFDESGDLLGFVFGLTGVEDGRLIHWSDLLAVRRDARNLGIGQRLKDLQWEVVAAQGVEVVYWTYDPLVARNAHLNLGKLGARVREYVEEMYPFSGAPTHDFGSDRFIVAWRVERSTERHEETSPPFDEDRLAELRAASIVNPGGVDVGAPRGRSLRVEVPRDIETLRQQAPQEATLWRRSTRKAFLTLLAQGYTVSTFFRDPETHRCFYHLTKNEGT